MLRSHDVGAIDDTVHLISGNGPGADWFQNALADPDVVVRFGDIRWRGRARAVVDVEERRSDGDLMGAKYGWDGDPSIGLTRHAWCYEVPVLAIDGWTER